MDYRNRYGSLSLAVVSDFLKVSEINDSIVADEYRITLDQAEQIALITGNRSIQIGLCPKPYIVWHLNVSHACICKISSLYFYPELNAREILEKLYLYFYLVCLFYSYFW